MSLKAIHILFIAASFALCVGFGGWAMREYYDANAKSHLIMGVLSFTSALALLVYGRYFLRKLKHVGFL